MAEHWAPVRASAGGLLAQRLADHVPGHRPGPDGPARAASAIEAPVGPARPVWNCWLHAAAEGHGQARSSSPRGSRPGHHDQARPRARHPRPAASTPRASPPPGPRSGRSWSPGWGPRSRRSPDRPVPPYANPLVPAVTTDDKGRFLIRGLGKDKVWLEVTHERFATQRMHAQPSAESATRRRPRSPWSAARVVEGRVTYGKGGKPAAGARVVAVTGYDNVVQCRTDDDGRYSLNPFPGDSFSPDRLPSRRPAVPALEAGRVVLAGRRGWRRTSPSSAGCWSAAGSMRSPSGRPVAGALVLYRRRNANNPYTIGYPAVGLDAHGVLPVRRHAGRTARSRSPYRPARATSSSSAPRTTYVHVETSVGELEYGRPSMIRNYPDGLIPLDLKPGSEPQRRHRDPPPRRHAPGPRARRPTASRPRGSSRSRRSYIPTGFELFQAPWNAMRMPRRRAGPPRLRPREGGDASGSSTATTRSGRP